MKPGVLKFGYHVKLSMYPDSFSSLLDLFTGLRLYKYVLLKIIQPQFEVRVMCTLAAMDSGLCDVYLLMNSSKIIAPSRQVSSNCGPKPRHCRPHHRCALQPKTRQMHSPEKEPIRCTHRGCRHAFFSLYIYWDRMYDQR